MNALPILFSCLIAAAPADPLAELVNNIRPTTKAAEARVIAMMLLPTWERTVIEKIEGWHDYKGEDKLHEMRSV
jgi:hypothetical protein